MPSAERFRPLRLRATVRRGQRNRAFPKKSIPCRHNRRCFVHVGVMSAHEPSAELLRPELRQYLARYLRRRLPQAEAEDAIQAVYCAALEARTIPQDQEQIRRWLTVIARRQVAAYYARTSTEPVAEPLELPDEDLRSEAVELRSLWRWAEEQAAGSQMGAVNETLDWMARESDGETLEAIAEGARIPSARIRQRVFRLRRFMKERWVLEISAAVVLVAIVSWVLTRRPDVPVAHRYNLPTPPVSMTPPMTPPMETPLHRAAELRESAFEQCNAEHFEECLRLLDEAAALDPVGDTDAKVKAVRTLIKDKQSPKAPPSPSTTSTSRTRSTSTTPSRTPFSSPFDSSGTP